MSMQSVNDMFDANSSTYGKQHSETIAIDWKAKSDLAGPAKVDSLEPPRQFARKAKKGKFDSIIFRREVSSFTFL